MSDGNCSAPTMKRPWTFKCTHREFRNVVHDFGEFAHGAADVRPRDSGSSGWRGGFSGRPGLLQDLMPSIAAMYAGSAPIRVQGLRSALRAFWRFIDAYEAWLLSDVALPRIDHLHQISGAILQAFSEPGPEGRWEARVGTHARVVRALILEAVHNADIKPISLAALSSIRSAPKDVVSEEEGIALIRHLRGAVTQVYRRWKRADRLAEQGADLVAIIRDSRRGIEGGFRPTEADAHATYRALIQRNAHPLPSVPALMSALDLKSGCLPEWWPRYQADQLPANRSAGDVVSWDDCIAGLYPTSADVSTFALLCLGRSAWNPAVLLRLDIEDWSASYDEDHAWIHSRKDRAGGAIQHSISALSHPTGFHQVVSRLIERNAPLRRWLADHPDAVPNAALAMRSPWLGSSKSRRTLFYVADPLITRTLNNWLAYHVDEHNGQRNANVQVRRISSTDFRDIAAATMYRESRYSMWVVMVMLGHKNLATTRIYVYRQAGRQESHRLVAEVVGDAMDQIERTQAWDPAITRARVEGVDVTPEARQRLEAHRKRRTYAGALCNDPCHPPIEIDPTHPQDGRTRCIQGHLCIARACPQATALNDSLGDICKCVADLEWRQLHTGAVRFSTGSEEQDLEHLRGTLKQWPSDAVETHLALWRARIQRGEHRPIWFGGQH